MESVKKGERGEGECRGERLRQLHKINSYGIYILSFEAVMALLRIICYDEGDDVTNVANDD